MKNKRYPLFAKSIRGVRPRRIHFSRSNNWQGGFKGKKKKVQYTLKEQKRIRRIQMFVILFLVCILTYYIYGKIERQLMPTVMTVANMKINSMSTQIINEAVEEVLKEHQVEEDDLVSYNYNEEGEIVSWGINTVAINTISSSVINHIGENIASIEHENIKIPFGNFLGQGAFSDWGPDLSVTIMPYGTTTINYGREFKAIGINQINHRVWLDVAITMKVIVPLDTKEIKVIQQVTLVDRVLHGDIPDSFVNVPEDNILDVAN